MSTTDDLQPVTAFLDEDECLVLPWKGKEYRIEPVSARTGLRIEKIMSAAEKAARDKDAKVDDQLLSDAEELDMYTDVLGDVYEEMLEDGISFRRLKLAATAAMMWTVYDEDIAIEFWEAGGKAPAPNRQQRRAATTRTGGASTTKRPASGTGTSTRRKPSGSARKAAG